MLHVFLDTNILENDPFLQQKKRMELLTKKGKLEILLPDVVVGELTKHTIKKSKDSISAIKKNLKTLKNIQFSNILEFQLQPYSQEEIKNKYNNLQTEGRIKIISSDSVKINRIMERYISEKKPFSENKESFRDYALFCTCSDYVSNNNLNNCYFISENSSDFANKDKTDFHDDLKTESNGMKYLVNIETFLSLSEVQEKFNEIQKEEEYEHLVEEWINTQLTSIKPRNDGELVTEWAIDNLKINNYLENLFNKKLYDSIENEIINRCMNAQPEDFSDFFDSGYVDYEGIDSIEEFDIQDFTASEDGSVTISGVIYLSVQVSIYVYNWSYERDEDDSRYICLASGDVQMHYSFDLTINEDDEYDVYYNLENIISDLGENITS